MPLDRLARSVAANNHGTQLPNTSAIVAIARDTALLRSLAFALEAHGYHVKTFPSWKSAKASMGEALCVIVDGGLPPDDRRAWHESLHAGNNVVLLADDDADHPTAPGLVVLSKPLSGPDVLVALAALRAVAT